MAHLAKLSPPRLPRVYPRARLLRRLDAARRRHRAIWITGLPGAGKTTLVACWLSRHRARAAWYQVDAGDADVASFFYFLAMTARRARINATLPAFTPEYRGGLELFARRFFRELGARLRQPAILVLDNLHEVPPEAALHEAIAFGIEEFPPGAVTVLVSRTAPPPAYARMRAYGAMRVLEPDDLKLSVQEARGIAGTRGRPLSSSRAAALTARADGWAAGVVLLLEGPATAAPPTSTDATPQSVFDFFAGEIFARTDADTREVLLRTALLPRPTAAAARRVCGGDHAAQVLADVARRGYFTFRHGGDEAYQYHPLFRQFLASRARELIPSPRLAELKRIAASALEAEGQMDDAAAVLCDCAAWDELGRIALAQAPGLLSSGRGDTLLRWVDPVPRDALERAPRLLYWIGIARAPAAPGDARRWLERAFVLCEAADDGEGAYLAWSGVVDTYVWEWSDFRGLGRWVAALDALERQYGPPSAGEVAARVALAAVAALAFHRPDHPGLARWSGEALGLALSTAVPLQVRVVAGTYLVVAEGWILGHLEPAHRVVEALAPVAGARGVDPATAILWRSGEAPYRWNVGDTAAARRVSAEALELARSSGVHVWDFMLHLQGVWTGLAADDPAEAARALDLMRATVVPGRILQSACSELAAALIALRAGEAVPGLRHAREAVLESREGGYPFAEALGQLATARLATATGADAEAVAALAAAAALGEAMRSAYFQYHCALASAMRALLAEDEVAALAPLRDALAVGRERGLGTHLWWSREETGELCALALAHGVEPEEARRLAVARGCAPPARARTLETWPWTLELRVLGRVELRRPDRSAVPAARVSQQTVNLLGLLVAAGDGGGLPERLAEDLWPQAEGDAAHHALEMALYRLRRLLGDPAAVVQHGGRIRLDRERCFVDAWALEQLLARGLALAGRERAGDELARVVASARVLAIGPFLGDRCDLAACRGYRERLAARLARLGRAVGPSPPGGAPGG
jgi:ATP/maltotriose-dependent transcriptional regulator MalT